RHGAEEEDAQQARRHERSSAVQQPLDEVAVGGAKDQAGGQSQADAKVADRGCDHRHRHRQDGTGHHGLPQHTTRRHLESSLTFNQTAAPPAARPTTSPTRTNTGAVFSTLSRATPPSRGSKTAAAK